MLRKNWISGKNYKIYCVLSSDTDCISMGDALREIDREVSDDCNAYTHVYQLPL